MRPAAALAAAALVIGQGAEGRTGDQREPANRLVTLETWVSAIASHAPAVDDSAVTAMRSLHAGDLEAAFAPMTAVLTAAAVPPARLRWDPLFGAHARRGFARAEFPRIKLLAARVAAFGLDRFLKHAAILHSDIGVIAPETHLTFSQGGSQLVEDGVLIAAAGRPLHWMLGGAFLHAVADAAADPAVLLWYQAVATHLWSTRTLVEAEPHLARAIAMFPRDGELQFARGLVHESLGAPYVRAGIDAQVAALPRAREGVMRVIESAESQQRRARDAFRAAVDLDEGHVEARIRLGRVLSLQGQHRRAVTELRAALAGAQHPTLRYYGYLFLGRASEAMGRLDDAIEAYGAAAAAFPRAQSPRLSLSRLALQRGDAPAGRAWITLLSGPPEPDADPWWVYHHDRQPHRDVWMARARTALMGKAR